MNKFFLLLICVFLSGVAQSQTVTVNKQNEKIKSESIEVFATSLEGKKEDIQAAWMKFLKGMGKLKQNSDPMLVSEPTINGTAFSGGIVYAGRKEGDKNTEVWIGINPSEWDSKDVTYANRELQKMLNQFGVKFYRDQVQIQINETEEALVAVEKQQQKLLNQSKDLDLKLSNSEQEKLQLEKTLETNKLENAALKIRLENNKKAQDSLIQVTGQIKKVMATYREKQGKIN
ncbi:MAG: hypothetical protein U5K54_29260 [Cytophagales bacterium]|nr:hypothetical protein [Cytophagales bacterium]